LNPRFRGLIARLFAGTALDSADRQVLATWAFAPYAPRMDGPPRWTCLFQKATDFLRRRPTLG